MKTTFRTRLLAGGLAPLLAAATAIIAPRPSPRI